MTVVKVLGGYLEVEGGGVAGGEPPSIWPSPGYPAHPIAPGGPPPGIWPSPGYPAHPIAPGGRPPGIWGGSNEGFPTHPIAPGGPPIVGIPPGIWPNPPEGTAPIVGHPIVIPPPEGVQGLNLEAKTFWTPQSGWMLVLVPTGTSPAPA